MLPLAQIGLLGAYVSPLVVVAIACAVVWLFVRRLFVVLGLVPLVWHPGLFFAALYAIMLGLVVLLVGGAFSFPLHSINP